MGRCSFDASQEIRNKHITREEAKSLCKKFDGELPKRYFNECLEYIGISEIDFWDITSKARSEHLWIKENNDWKLRHTSFDE